jgi:predicted dinucleotide-binding enzyme
MTIAFIGAGRIGGTLARLALASGYDVVVSNSRGPETLAGPVAEFGEHASAATPEQAGREGDVLVVSIPTKAYRQVPAEPLAGTVVIDTCNYYPDRDGHLPELDGGSTSSSELIAAHLPGANVVKAFNSIRFDDLGSQGTPPGAVGRRAIPIAGDAEYAKGVVASLTDEFGFDVLDVGPLRDGRRFQPGTATYAVPMVLPELHDALVQTTG